MEVLKEPLPGLKVIRPEVYKDERGFFLETWQKERYEKIGLTEDFVQDNWSRSTKGVLRGLHYQKTNPQGKLVSVINGKIFDVAVDIRKSSSTFGQWYGGELSERNHLQMYIPSGFAHGFYVLSDIADIVYKCTDFYAPDNERTIHWADKELNIDWPLSLGGAIVSEKDAEGVVLEKADLFD